MVEPNDCKSLYPGSIPGGTSISRDSAEAAHKAHTLGAVGSNPTPATNFQIGQQNGQKRIGF